MLERLTTPDVDVVSLFQADREQQKAAAVDVEKQKLERYETEAFYINVSTLCRLCSLTYLTGSVQLGKRCKSCHLSLCMT